jgi:hypothetical protein
VALYWRFLSLSIILYRILTPIGSFAVFGKGVNIVKIGNYLQKTRQTTRNKIYQAFSFNGSERNSILNLINNNEKGSLKKY